MDGWMDWIGYPGGRKYRAPQGANKKMELSVLPNGSFHEKVICFK